MTYQVLARKWRPKSFAELAGQGHVVQALTNALSRGRLHHAYLLTGTRGVGKTTIARILAKSLNCLTHGVTATPCGTCAACVDIDAGRFVDLLELDAASNTGIDNMREILDNARYAPTVGRYKVYLIDEVHMLSKAAFNSMLKTLEEPPEHVKFVLATTDPQKIPVTVLSRCLQFNLKQLPPALIEERLATILVAEAIANDRPALALIARAAQGSMRDALSLLDQAIAYGGGEVREPAVREMLGAVDTEHVYRIVDALRRQRRADAARRGRRDRRAQHRLRLRARRAGVAVPPGRDGAGGAGCGRGDGRWRTGGGVCCRPPARSGAARVPDLRAGARRSRARARRGDRVHDDVAAPACLRARRQRDRGVGSAESRRPAAKRAAGTGGDDGFNGRRAFRRRRDGSRCRHATAGTDAFGGPIRNPGRAGEPGRSLPTDPAGWPAFVAGLKLSGIVGQLAAQTELVRCTGRELVLGGPGSAAASDRQGLCRQAEGRARQKPPASRCGSRSSLPPTPTHRSRRRRAASVPNKRRSAEAAFRNEPFVRDVVARFDATIKPDSIKRVS